MFCLSSTCVLVWAIGLKKEKFTQKPWAESFSFFMILLYFWKFSKIRWRVFRLQKPSRNHFLHLQLRGNNTPPNYVIDYRFPLQTWKKVNSLLLTALNNQLFRRHSKLLFFFCNKRVKSVQGDSSNVTKSIACQSCITEEYDQRQLCDQVKPSARVDVCALVGDAFTDPCSFHWSMLLSLIGIVIAHQNTQLNSAHGESPQMSRK